MRLFTSVVVLTLFTSFMILACGGGGKKTPDAAPPNPVCGNGALEGTEQCDDGNTANGDGCSSTCTTEAAGLSGLGQKCGTGLPACPANAPDCVGFTQGKTFCSPICLANGTGTTNGSGQFTGSGAGALNPLPNDATCTGAFTGTIGTAGCDAIVAVTPPDNPLLPNKQYTAIQFDCSISCAMTTNACPPTTTCNTGIGVCEPN